MMKRVSVKTWVMFVAVFLSLSLFAQKEDERVLITIEDEEVSVAEFLNVYTKNNVDTDLSDKKSLNEYLDLYINFRLKVKEARDLGMDTVSSFVEELAGYRKQLAEPYFNDQEVTDELLEEAYNRMLFDIRASHILIKVDANALAEDTLIAFNKAMSARDRVLNGEKFSTVAMEVSEDPSARDRENQGQLRKGNGGDLGYFTVFDMVYPFETGAYNTAVGEVSMPVRTSFGYHIIMVTDKQPALGKATVAHLYLMMPRNATPEDSARKKEEIYELYEKAITEKDWDALVLAWSDDRGSKEKGGVLPRFGSNRMVPEFIAAVAALQDTGDISQPVLTSFGWHILKLIERQRPGDFETELPELKRRMTKDSRSQKSRETVINRIKKENGFKEYPENLHQLLMAIDSSYLAREWDAAKVAEMDKKILVLGGKKYTQHDFGLFLQERQTRRGANPMEAFFYIQYKEYVDGLCVDLEDSKLENTYPEFRMLMQEYRDGILLFNLTDQKVWSMAVKDTTGLKNYYNEHKNNYMWGERLEADIIIINDPGQEDDIREMVTMAKKKSLKELGLDTLKGVFVENGLYPRGENAFIDKIEWKEGLSVSLPLTDFSRLYDGRSHGAQSIILANVREVRKPEVKTMDESRGMVTSDYQNYLEKEWIRELKEKYTVTVNKEVLESIE